MDTPSVEHVLATWIDADRQSRGEVRQSVSQLALEQERLRAALVRAEELKLLVHTFIEITKRETGLELDPDTPQA